MTSSEAIQQIRDKLTEIENEPNLYFRIAKGLDVARLAGALCVTLTAELFAAMGGSK